MNNIVNNPTDSLPAPAQSTVIHAVPHRHAVSATFRLLVLAFTLLVITAEAITAFVSVIAGAVLYSIMLLILANLAYFSHSHGKRRVYQAFMLLPLLRILSLSMPIQKVPTVYQYILTGLPLLIATFLVVRSNGLPSLRLNLSALEWFYQAIIAVSGIPLGMVAVVYLEAPPNLINNSNILSIFLLWVVFTLFGAVMEEIIFRGLIQKAYSYSFRLAGVLLTSLVYASMFLGTLSPKYVIFYGLTGLLFSIWVQISDSLVGVIMAHSLMNIVFVLMAYLVK